MGDRKADLEYDRTPATVTVRGFRTLVVLLSINTVMLGWFVAGPQTADFAKQQWRQWRQRREVAAALKVKRAALATCRAHVDPEGFVVYEENLQRAAALAASGSGYRTAFNGSAPPGWRPPVFAPAPPAFQGVFDSRAAGVAFMHERLTPAGNRRLILVSLDAEQKFSPAIVSGVKGTSTTWRLSKSRKLHARVYETDMAAGKPFKAFAGATLPLIVGDEQIERFAITWQERPLERVAFAPEQQLRIFAGQPDAKDPSRFTIPYQLNDVSGVIDGRVTDDGVTLTCREGTPLHLDGEPAWDLRPTTAPATAPTSRPAP